LRSGCNFSQLVLWQKHRKKFEAKGDCSNGRSIQNRLQKISSDQGCTVTISGSIDEVVELGWLHAKTHHVHKDDEQTGIKEWIRGNAEAAND
jgi:uncharacterized Fe-S cluster-containing radical SAM superfamily protein